LPHAGACEVACYLVGQGATPGDYADGAGGEKGGGHDAGVAPTRRDDTGTVGSDEVKASFTKRILVEPQLNDHLGHVTYRDGLGNDNN